MPFDPEMLFSAFEGADFKGTARPYQLNSLTGEPG
jgi:hypothetical protein